MKGYTKEEIEQLSKNPIVRSVDEKRLTLTYEFRVELFKEWEKESRYGNHTENAY